MAQLKIRKFSPGGTLRTETGETFTLEEVEKLVQENPTNENLKDIANEMRAGRDVTHNISDNWSSVTSDDFNGGQKRRVAKGPNSLARRLAATFNTPVHQYGEDVNDTTAILSAAKNTTNSNSSASTTPEKTDEFKMIAAGDGTPFVYDSETGAYAKGDFTNARLMSMLSNLDDYLSGNNNYKFKGLSADTRQVLKDMYTTNNNFLKELMQKVRSGKIVAGSPEASILLNLGIGSNVTKDALEAAEKERALKQHFIDKGFTEDQFKDLLPYVELDNQGLRLKSGVEGSPFMAGQNYYFNDEYNGVFKDILNGQMLFNNRFYDANQLAESGMISDWVKALKDHDFEKANSMIRWDWNDRRNDYDYQMFDSENLYNEFLNGKRYLDVTGQYEKQYDDNGNEYQIMGYYDPNDASSYTKLGFVDPSKIKYARFDSMGNLVDEDYNTSYLRKSLNPWKHKSVFQERRNDGQVVIPSVTTRDGKGVLGMDVTFDPDKGNIRFSGAAVQDVLGTENGDTIELDGRIAQILSPEFIDNLEQSNKADLKKFKDTILSLVGNKMGNLWTRNQLSRKEWADLLRPTYGDAADRYALEVYQYFKNYIGKTDILYKIGAGTGLYGFGLWSPSGQTSRQARLHEFTPKHQHGGLFTGSAVEATSAPKIVQSDKYIPATTEEAGVTDIANWTDADYWELGGLVADLGSVVTGMSGFTPASVATGLAGTGATFLADIKRDGFQAKDLGNLGLGLLFDAASIVPGLGVGASSTKTMKAIKKGLPVLMKLAGLTGVGSAVSLAVNKIRSGEELTMKDLRVIMNGALGAYTMAKQGIDITNSRKTNGATIDVDVNKMHMDQIDASNLSEGQKAAMKYYFENNGGRAAVDPDYVTSLSTEQKAIFDRFVADGHDETALKMLIGENQLFTDLRADRELLEKAKNALNGGEQLNKEDLAKYRKLVENSGARRLLAEDYNAQRNLDSDNDELARLLKDAYDPSKSPAERATALNDIDNRFRHDVATGAERAEYKEFFEAWDNMPAESRYTQLERMLNGLSPDAEYHGGMFEKKNTVFGEDTNWAAEVKNREKRVNDVLAKDNFEQMENAQKTYFDAEDTVKQLESEQRRLRRLKTKTKEDDKRLAKLPSELLEARKAKKAAEDLLDNEVLKHIAFTDEAEKLIIPGSPDNDIQFNSTTGRYEKTSKLNKDVRTVKDQFNQIDDTTVSKLREEFKDLDQASSEATYLADRDARRKSLIDDYLTSTSKNKVQKEFDVTVEQEFNRLSPEEKTKIKEIFKKDLDKISEEEIDLLNFYTAKQNGAVSEVDAALISRTADVKTKGASETLSLKKDLGIDAANALLRKSNLPNSSQMLLSEVDWAKIRKADNQLEEFKSVMRKKGLDDKMIDVLSKELFEQVPKESSSEPFWKRKKSKKSSDSENSTEMVDRLNLEKFKTRHKNDNSLLGKILGRSASQQKYAKEMYRFDERTPIWNSPRDIQKTAHRYYQPMLHGIHYNLFRDPVHHTPWYDPKEINEEE